MKLIVRLLRQGTDLLGDAVFNLFLRESEIQLLRALTRSIDYLCVCRCKYLSINDTLVVATELLPHLILDRAHLILRDEVLALPVIADAHDC